MVSFVFSSPPFPFSWFLCQVSFMYFSLWRPNMPLRRLLSLLLLLLLLISLIMSLSYIYFIFIYFFGGGGGKKLFPTYLQNPLSISVGFFEFVLHENLRMFTYGSSKVLNLKNLIEELCWFEYNLYFLVDIWAYIWLFWVWEEGLGWEKKKSRRKRKKKDIKNK